MPVKPLSVLIYEIHCPKCKKNFLHPLGKVVTENFTNCPTCHEHIKATNYYQRSRVIELMEQVGYIGDFISVNDRI